MTHTIRSLMLLTIYPTIPTKPFFPLKKQSCLVSDFIIHLLWKSEEQEHHLTFSPFLSLVPWGSCLPRSPWTHQIHVNNGTCERINHFFRFMADMSNKHTVWTVVDSCFALGYLDYVMLCLGPNGISRLLQNIFKYYKTSIVKLVGTKVSEDLQNWIQDGKSNSVENCAIFTGVL